MSLKSFIAGNKGGAGKKVVYYMYAWVNTRTNKFVYVGMTCDLLLRIRCHESGFKLAYALGFKDRPGLVILEIMKPCYWADAHKREVYWMRKLLREGHPLINMVPNQ